MRRFLSCALLALSLSLLQPPALTAQPPTEAPVASLKPSALLADLQPWLDRLQALLAKVGSHMDPNGQPAQGQTTSPAATDGGSEETDVGSHMDPNG